MVDNIFYLSVTIISVLGTTIMALYQIHRGQKFEKEKYRIEIYSDYLSYCTKRIAHLTTKEDDLEFTKIFTKLLLIADPKLNAISGELYDHITKNQINEKTYKLLEELTQIMRHNLKIFNRRFDRVLPHA